MTKGQFSNQKYRHYRWCMITGSIIHQNILQNVIEPEWQGIGCQPTHWNVYGHRKIIWWKYCHQNKAAKSYVVSLADLHQDLQNHEYGLLVYKDYSFIGGSMDRVRTCKCHPPRPVEIKCPSTMAKKPKGTPFLSRNRPDNIID